MKENARWLAVALVVWLLAWAVTSWRTSGTPVERPSWQHPVSELTGAQRQTFDEVRAAILSAELARSRDGAWPDTFLPGFTRSTLGLHTGYVGAAAGLRWLVLFIEPDRRLGPEDAGLDDEHHRLADGTMIHVTVWTQGLDAPPPTELVAFPAAEGWLERVRD